MARTARPELSGRPSRAVRIRAGRCRPDDLGPRCLGRRSASRAGARCTASRALPRLPAPADDRYADGRRTRPAPIRRPGDAAVRSIRPARIREALLRPRAAEARNDPRDRALAEPLQRMRAPQRAAGPGERARVAAIRRQVPQAGAALPQDALQRDPDRGAERVRRAQVPLDRRGAGTHSRHRQHQVRFPATRGDRGPGQALAREQCIGASALGRGQHARGRGGDRARCAPAGTGALSRCTPDSRASPPAAFRFRARHARRGATIALPIDPPARRYPARPMCCSATRWANS